MSEFFRKPIVKTLMLKGQEGQSIKGIEKTSTNVLVDTYTITLTDGTTSTFTVSNGKGIKTFAKTSTSGLVDTYTITYNDGTSSTFTVKNGEKGDTGSIENLLDRTYPVGSIYMSVNSTSPAELFGGTWEQLKDRFLLATGDTHEAGSTGGEEEHTLITSEMPKHKHVQMGIDSNMVSSFNTGGDKIGGRSIDDASKYTIGYKSYTKEEGGGLAHNNMPPYLAVYMWKRIA